MSEPDSPAEPYRQAFQQQLAHNKVRYQTMILLLAQARMHAAVAEFDQAYRPRVSLLQRMYQRVRRWVRRPTAVPTSDQSFPWGVHGEVVVQACQPTQPSPQKESPTHEQPGANHTTDDSACQPAPPNP